MSATNILNINSATVPLVVTSTSGYVGISKDSEFVLVSNLGASNAWCLTSDLTTSTAVPSTGNNVCVPAGAIMVLRKGDTVDSYFHAVTSSGTTTLSISMVDGV